MDQRYLRQVEESRISNKPLALEVIENVQEAIWSGISSSLRAVLRRLVNLALEDEATERVGAPRYERSPDRKAYRNGTYARDLHTSFGPV